MHICIAFSAHPFPHRTATGASTDTCITRCLSQSHLLGLQLTVHDVWHGNNDHNDTYDTKLTRTVYTCEGDVLRIGVKQLQRERPE